MSQVPTAADRPYVRAHFDAILNVAPKHLRKYLRVDDRGVWPNLEDDAIHPAVDPLLWQPQEETDGDPVKTPALPFPFGARELAAFMVAGVGSSIQECFGAWNSGPDPALLYDLGRRTVKSREALIQAYELYRRCEQELEKLNSAVVSSFEEADTRFETARHSDQENSGVDQVIAANARWRALKDGQKPWQQAMVRELLGAPNADELRSELPPRVPIMKANRARVLVALRAAGFDPLALPPVPRGKEPCPAKAAARERASLGKSAFRHAWESLTKDGTLRRG